jgi:PucR family transcriptional regulator, purine catabolism regulatory protein
MSPEWCGSSEEVSVSLPTVASLSTRLGADLVPAPGFTTPSTPVTAVHISELADPTDYLSGGELLLTTGLALPLGRTEARRYVARLVRAGVAALGFGIGPAHDHVPEPLIAACRTAGLCLLVVPGPTPFLRVSKMYWESLSRATARELQDALAAHRALVDAAAGTDATSTVLRRLSRTLDGWAALLEPDGEVEQIFPAGMVQEAAALRSEVARLDVAGAHSAASFEVEGRFAVLFPLALEERVVGYLAVGTGTKLDEPSRRLVLTACALLAVDAVRTTQALSATRATQRSLATLVELGRTESARALAAALGGRPLPHAARVLALRARDVEVLLAAVERVTPQALPVAVTRESGWCLVPEPVRDVDALLRALDVDPARTAVLSAAVPLGVVSRVRRTAQAQLDALPDGATVVAPAPGAALERFDELLAQTRPELVSALVVFLRHRGQWESAARAIGTHRNTLRHRVAALREAWGVDLDDPDLAARLWLLLRERELA